MEKTEIKTVEKIFENIMYCTQIYFGVTREELMSQRKLGGISYARTITMALMMEHTKVGPSRVGRYMNKLYTAPARAISFVAEQSKTDEDVREDMRLLREYIQYPDCAQRKENKKIIQFSERESTPPKLVRPKAEYSNRSMEDIYRHYESIQV